MSRSSRKRRRRRARASERPAAQPAPERRAAERRPIDETPPLAPWGSFPLVELVVLAGLVMLVGGLVVGGTQGGVAVTSGIVLCSLGGLELSIREHVSGYRSHTLLLAGVPAVIVLAVLFYFGPDGLAAPLRVAIAAAAFALAAAALAALFRRRSGGLSFRIRGFRG